MKINIQAVVQRREQRLNRSVADDLYERPTTFARTSCMQHMAHNNFNLLTYLHAFVKSYYLTMICFFNEIWFHNITD